MNKNAIQKYAVWARNELIDQIKQRAFQYGIDEKGYGDENAAAIAGRVLFDGEKRQRLSFINEIKHKGYQQAVEEVAYTWFNRFVALRFMEVNDYLPTHVRVLSDVNGTFSPEILKDVLHLEFPGLDSAKVAELINANATEDLYRYLLLTQCNALNEALPEMFERMGGYTEILLPNNILRQGGVLERLVTDIPEEDWHDAVQIIGWMYQYYNTEPKQAVFDGLKKNIKISKENIPAATQLFTPDWIVRYMVQNSLGRLWLEGHPDDELQSNWKYYLPEAEQTPEVTAELEKIRSEARNIKPEDITVLDPCMGSGHILVYAFDLLIQIYRSAGYSDRDAAKLILENNIYGLDIDKRAYQLAYFALMMKARQYNRRIFSMGVKPQIYHPAGYADGEQYGSLLKIDEPGVLPENISIGEQINLKNDYSTDLHVWNFKRLLSQKYDVVVTNPPYMGASGMGDKLKNFISNNYPDSKGDTFSSFIEQGMFMVKSYAYSCMVTMQGWMTIASYEALRRKLIKNNTLCCLMQMDNMVMGIAFATAVSVFGKYKQVGYKGIYSHIKYSDILDNMPQEFPISENNFIAVADNFNYTPSAVIAYWVSNNVLEILSKQLPLSHFADARKGLTTGDNDRFLRFWHEISISNFSTSIEPAKFHAMTKGGKFRKWYGNNEYVVNWENNGSEISNFKDESGKLRSRPQNIKYYFRECISWNDTTSTGKISFRYQAEGYIPNALGPCVYCDDRERLIYLLGLLNSCVSQALLDVLTPNMKFEVGQMALVPIIISNINVKPLVDGCVEIAKTDWDSFETSWDFRRYPLIRKGSIEDAFQEWEREAAERFATLKANEEELNRIFINVYGLQDELMPVVEDKDVTVRRAELRREICSLISYAVGCMFGRYSLDVEGLACAGGEWDATKYNTIIPDKDNILPICDDEYFEDDIVGQFVDFICKAYNPETLEENLKYIADALGGKGTSREVIRNYFLNDFFKDHCKIYQKRPIYWLFDSGKKNGFKALTYLHRYSSDLLAKLRTDYVHEQQERYRSGIAHIASLLPDTSGAEHVRLTKRQAKLTDQLREISAFEEKVHHLADSRIEIDLDDGVKHNYEIFADVLAKI